MELFDVIRTLKFIEGDDRIKGIIADFSSTTVPSVPSYNLGLAQLEEIQDAMLELGRVKRSKENGTASWKTVAWTDTFTSQGQYLLASTFDEIYTQPTGEVPLVGMGSTTPFFGKLLKWLGIEVHAEARNEYKSFVQPYIDEKLTDPQRENHRELISELNDNLLTYIGRNRFSSRSSSSSNSSLAHVKSLTQQGPFTADLAVENGLLNGTCYRQDILDSLLDPEFGGDSDSKLMGFYHYSKVVEKAMEKYMGKEAIDVGVVYLMGTIGDPGEFGTAAVVRGLKEAGEDESIGAVVLRIDSGGGGVVDSDTIWGAVRDLRERKGKTVVASFGNSSASGGYLVSTHTDAIFAAPSTVTGSIGVASLRPFFSEKFFENLHLTLESFFTGSRSQDVTHKLTRQELERHSKAVDSMYEDFKQRVCEGRGISKDVIESIAGGRVMTGLRAFGLTAPKQLIDQIKGIDSSSLSSEEENKIEVVDDHDDSGSTTITMSSPVEKIEGRRKEEGEEGEAEVAVQEQVRLDKDQETSPFAIPESSTDTPPVISTGTGPTSPEAHVLDALRTSTVEEQIPNSELKDKKKKQKTKEGGGANNGVSGEFEYELGPYGRGLVDGLGGLRDAAVYACQMFIANGVAGYKETNPEVSDEEAIKHLLPDAKFATSEDGEMALAVDGEFFFPILFSIFVARFPHLFNAEYFLCVSPSPTETIPSS
jgi:signal peptide peptidase SppA